MTRQVQDQLACIARLSAIHDASKSCYPSMLLVTSSGMATEKAAYAILLCYCAMSKSLAIQVGKA